MALFESFPWKLVIIIILGYFTIPIIFKKGEIGWIFICRQGRDLQLLMMHDFCTTWMGRGPATTMDSLRLKKIDLKTGRILFDAPCVFISQNGMGRTFNENSILGITKNYIYLDFADYGWRVLDFTTGRKLLDDKLLLSKNKELKGYADNIRPWFNPETGNIVITDIMGDRFEVLVDECGLLPFSKTCKREKATRTPTGEDDFECFSLFEVSDFRTFKVSRKYAKTYLDAQILVLGDGRRFKLGPPNRPEFIIIHRSNLARGAGWSVSCAPTDGPPRWELNFSDLGGRRLRNPEYKLHMFPSDEGLYIFFTEYDATKMSFSLVNPETGEVKMPPRHIVNWRTPRKYFKLRDRS